jgi:hypothetical protein
MFVFRAFHVFRLSALKNKNSALFEPPRAKKNIVARGDAENAEEFIRLTNQH